MHQKDITEHLSHLLDRIFTGGPPTVVATIITAGFIVTAAIGVTIEPVRLGVIANSTRLVLRQGAIPRGKVRDRPIWEGIRLGGGIQSALG